MLQEISEKYADPSSCDKLTAVQEKIDVVKTTMKDNIQQLLENSEKLEQIETATVHLNEQSKAFQSNSKELRYCIKYYFYKAHINLHTYCFYFIF